MTPVSQCRDLLSLYSEWEALSEAEGEAISAGVWGKVAVCQSRKAALQEAIQRRSDALFESAGVLSDHSGRTTEIRKKLEVLILKERSNARLLETQKALAEERRHRLDLSGRNLQRLRTSYVPRLDRSWQSYS